MPTPSKGYSWSGEKFPGTTTIIGRFKDSGGLLHWAFKQGQSGARHLYEKAEEAANIGTAAHAMVEAHINGEDPQAALLKLFPEGESKAVNAFNMYLKWEKQTNIKMLSRFQELQLVSPEFKFGGTPDAIGEIDGEIVLLDWKTSNSIYSDYLIQLAAYKYLIEHGIRMDNGESLGLTITRGFHLCRFAKDFPDFGHYYFGELDNAWEQFKLLRKAYDIDRELKRRTA